MGVGGLGLCLEGPKSMGQRDSIDNRYLFYIIFSAVTSVGSLNMKSYAGSYTLIC